MVVAESGECQFFQHIDAGPSQKRGYDRLLQTRRIELDAHNFLLLVKGDPPNPIHVARAVDGPHLPFSRPCAIAEPHLQLRHLPVFLHSQDTTIECQSRESILEGRTRRTMADPGESQMTAVDPVCGMKVRAAAAKHTAEHDGTTYYFCCGGCATKFTADPSKYLSKSPGTPTSGLVSLGMPASKPVTAKDPVCGMDVDPATAKAKAEFGGKIYYFCCPGCATKFQADAEKYLNKPAVTSGLVTLGAPAPSRPPRVSPIPLWITCAPCVPRFGRR